MQQFVNKLVRYIGKTNSQIDLHQGQKYRATHVYGGNVGVITYEDISCKRTASTPAKNFEIIQSMDTPYHVHSILTLVGEPVGIRILKEGQYYDVGIGSLAGFTPLNAIGFKKQSLIEHGDILVTQEELNSNLLTIDKSKDKTFCSEVKKILGL